MENYELYLAYADEIALHKIWTSHLDLGSSHPLIWMWVHVLAIQNSSGLDPYDLPSGLDPTMAWTNWTNDLSQFHMSACPLLCENCPLIFIQLCQKWVPLAQVKPLNVILIRVTLLISPTVIISFGITGITMNTSSSAKTPFFNLVVVEKQQNKRRTNVITRLWGAD